jgi:hypothetical protein
MALNRKRPLFETENEHLLKRQFFLTTATVSNPTANSSPRQIRPLISQQRFIISNRIKTENNSANHPNLTQLLLNKSEVPKVEENK